MYLSIVVGVLEIKADSFASCKLDEFVLLKD